MEFAGLLAFLVLIYWRPQDFVVAIYGWRLVLAITGITILLWMVRESAYKEYRKIISLPQDYFIIWFYLAAVLSTYTVNWLWYTREMAIEIGKLVIFYLMVSQIVDSENRLRNFCYTLMFLTTLIAGVAILQRYGIDITGSGMVEVNRIQGIGIYHNPNYLAYSLILVIPLQYWLFRGAPSRTWRLFSLASLIISFWCIIWTKSRGGMLCLVVVMLFVLSEGKRFMFKTFLRGFAVLLILLLFAVGSRFETLYLGEKSIEARIDSWYAALLLFKEHPFIGVGIKCFDEYHSKLTTHSSFALVGAEMGLIGLFMWLGFLYHNMKILHRYGNNKEEKLGVYVKALRGSLVAYFVMAFFVTFPYRITLFILCGLVAATARLIQLKRPPEAPEAYPVFSFSDFRNIAFLEVGIVILWHLIIKHGHFRG